MNNSPLLKYKIGLGVLGLISLALLVVVLMQAGGVKQDAETYKKANKVATSLDNYVNSKGQVPSTLAVAGITDVPDTVSYTKISTTKYKFCVTYKSDSSNFDPTTLETQLMTGGQASDFSGKDLGESSYLYLSSSHHKGENCQTVKTYSFDDYDYDYDSSYPTNTTYPTDYDTESL